MRYQVLQDCEVCRQSFFTSKYTPARTCSKSCQVLITPQNQKRVTYERNCLGCGGIFNHHPSSRTDYCDPDCASKDADRKNNVTPPETPIWRNIPGYEGRYQVSRNGEVRSLAFYYSVGRSVRVNEGRILSPSITKQGYARVSLSGKFHSVHRLVCFAFLGPPPPGHIALHGRRGVSDNSLNNLRWGTYSENMKDRRKDGTDRQVNKTHCVHGHEYTDANTGRTVKGRRYCKTCRSNRKRKR
jgi:hypothetical protein